MVLRLIFYNYFVVIYSYEDILFDFQNKEKLNCDYYSDVPPSTSSLIEHNARSYFNVSNSFKMQLKNRKYMLLVPNRRPLSKPGFFLLTKYIKIVGQRSKSRNTQLIKLEEGGHDRA